MIKYVISNRSGENSLPRIGTFLIERETEKSVYTRSGKRFNKKSSYDCFFNSWEEARCALLKIQEQRVGELRYELATAYAALQEIFKMEKK